MIKQKFQKIDWLWLLALPVYQIIGTIRHEGSHALAALWEGVSVSKFVFWPSLYKGKFYWGYVLWSGQANWFVYMAPYLCDLLWFLAFFLVLLFVKIKRRWIWINLFIIGLASPLVNSIYNYSKIFWARGDIEKILGALPDWLVHFYFIGTILLYIGGIVYIIRRNYK